MTVNITADRMAGATWTQIGAASAMSKQAAWEAHDRWISSRAHAHRDHPDEGLDPAQLQKAETVAGHLADENR